ALPMNTGAEAVETAIKAARKWAYTKKGVPADQAEIIACEGNFHGRTIAIVGLSTEKQYRDGFGPFPAGLKQIPFGNTEALEKAITPNTAAFLVEPIQGEGGIIVPPEGYLNRCASLCRQHQVLLICDEVQSGLGRTGKLMAYQHDSIQPDGLILGKALGGGLLPVSLFLANDSLMSVFTPGDHGSTFGGYPLAAVVAKEALDILVEENLSQRSHEMGLYFMEGLHQIVKRLDNSLVKEVRGRGLFIGLDINQEIASARDVCEKLMDKGLLSKDTHHTVVRFAPPLVITKEEIDWSLEQIEFVLGLF
ncbi:MAG: ornithine--oxo-acid transaminase, partial [Pseudomonadales bacterium]|nr:ornithine--oxo-acid transaminase [Pseudomonadales bacterium]